MKLKFYTKSKYTPQAHPRAFFNLWYNNPHCEQWLVYSPIPDKVYCLYCDLFEQPNGDQSGADFFSIGGCSNCKLFLEKNKGTAKHVCGDVNSIHNKSIQTETCLLDKKVTLTRRLSIFKQTDQNNGIRLHLHGRMARHLAVQGLEFRATMRNNSGLPLVKILWTLFSSTSRGTWARQTFGDSTKNWSVYQQRCSERPLSCHSDISSDGNTPRDFRWSSFYNFIGRGTLFCTNKVYGFDYSRGCTTGAIQKCFGQNSCKIRNWWQFMIRWVKCCRSTVCHHQWFGGNDWTLRTTWVVNSIFSIKGQTSQLLLRGLFSDGRISWTFSLSLSSTTIPLYAGCSQCAELLRYFQFIVKTNRYSSWQAGSNCSRRSCAGELQSSCGQNQEQNSKLCRRHVGHVIWNRRKLRNMFASSIEVLIGSQRCTRLRKKGGSADCTWESIFFRIRIVFIPDDWCFDWNRNPISLFTEEGSRHSQCSQACSLDKTLFAQSSWKRMENYQKSGDQLLWNSWHSDSITRSRLGVTRSTSASPEGYFQHSVEVYFRIELFTCVIDELLTELNHRFLTYACDLMTKIEVLDPDINFLSFEEKRSDNCCFMKVCSDDFTQIDIQALERELKEFSTFTKNDKNCDVFAVIESNLPMLSSRCVNTIYLGAFFGNIVLCWFRCLFAKRERQAGNYFVGSNDVGARKTVKK